MTSQPDPDPLPDNDYEDPPPWCCEHWGWYEHDWFDCPECQEAYERYLAAEGDGQ